MAPTWLHPHGGFFFCEDCTPTQYVGGLYTPPPVPHPGIPQCVVRGFRTVEYGQVTLCQFCDNVLIATDFAGSPETPIVQTVCDMLHQC